MTIADEGETDTDVYYEISLTVTDSDGATRTVSRNVTPNVRRSGRYGGEVHRGSSMSMPVQQR